MNQNSPLRSTNTSKILRTEKKAEELFLNSLNLLKQVKMKVLKQFSLMKEIYKINPFGSSVVMVGHMISVMVD